MRLKKEISRSFTALIAILVILLSAVNVFASMTFYSNPENIEEYNGYGLYPENKHNKKILLTDSNWQVRIEGDKKWQNIYIPSAYDIDDSGKKVFFKKSFYLGGLNASERNYKLVFYGVNYRCNVKINGNFVENHASGSSTFEIALNNNLLNFNGENELYVEVNNDLSIGKTIPMKMQIDGWNNYGGIFRDVFLMVSSQIAIDDADIIYSFDDDYQSCNVEVNAKVKDFNFIKVANTDTLGYSSSIYSYIEISYKNNGKVVYQSDKQMFDIQRFSKKEIKFRFSLKNLKMWTPETPYLYQCSIFLGKKNEYNNNVDFNQFDFNFGLKDLFLKEGQFYLNGKVLKIKGVSKYEDVKDMGSAITYSQMNQDIEKIKNMGVNVLNCVYTPPHPYVLDLCDKYGLLVMENIPVFSIPSEFLDNESIVEISRYNLSELIQRDKNHVSLFAIGMGSGYDVYDLKAVDFIKDLSDEAKDINSNILTFFKSKYTDFNEYFRLTDFNLIDFNTESVNDEKLISKISSRAVKSPIVISNTLKSVFPNSGNDFQDSNSEPAQAKDVVKVYKKVSQYSNIGGLIINSFADHLSEIPLMSTFPGENRYLVNNGLVDYDGKDRISFRVVEALYKGRKAPSLTHGDYEVKSTNMFFYVGIFFSIFFIYMLQREHYFRINSLRSIYNPDAFFVDIRDRRITQMWQATLVGVFVSVGLASTFSTIFYSFRTSDKFDYLLTHFIRNNNIKEYVIESSWEPLKFIVVVTLAILLFLLLISLYVKLISMIYNIRLSFGISLSMVFWSNIVFIIFLPLSAVLLRMVSAISLRVILIIFFILILWMVYRLFLMMSVAFKTSIQKIIWFNFLVFITLVIIYFYYFHQNLYTTEYLNYFLSVVLK